MIVPRRLPKVLIVAPQGQVVRKLRKGLFDKIDVFEAHGEKNAIAVYEANQPFDLIVSSCCLTGGSDPVRVVKYIRASGDETDILVISHSYENGERMRAAGATDFIDSSHYLVHAVRASLDL